MIRSISASILTMVNGMLHMPHDPLASHIKLEPAGTPTQQMASSGCYSQPVTLIHQTNQGFTTGNSEQISPSHRLLHGNPPHASQFLTATVSSGEHGVPQITLARNPQYNPTISDSAALAGASESISRFLDSHIREQPPPAASAPPPPLAHTPLAATPGMTPGSLAGGTPLSQKRPNASGTPHSAATNTISPGSSLPSNNGPIRNSMIATPPASGLSQTSGLEGAPHLTQERGNYVSASGELIMTTSTVTPVSQEQMLQGVMAHHRLQQVSFVPIFLNSVFEIFFPILLFVLVGNGRCVMPFFVFTHVLSCSSNTWTVRLTASA